MRLLEKDSYLHTFSENCMVRIRLHLVPFVLAPAPAFDCATRQRAGFGQQKCANLFLCSPYAPAGEVRSSAADFLQTEERECHEI
jgi:hypothetical protein